MMELEHVPKARLLVRHPVRRAQSAITPPVETSPLRRAPVVSANFTRSSSAPNYTVSMSTDGPAVPPYSPPIQHIHVPTGITGGYDLNRNPMDPNALLSEASFFPPSVRGSNFDVTRLGSLRYQYPVNGISPSRMFPQNTVDPFGMAPLQSTGSYGSFMDPIMPSLYYDPVVPPLAPPATTGQGRSLFPVRNETGAGVPQNPFGVMIPTPRFITGDRTQRGGGPIEVPEMKRGALSGQETWNCSQELLKMDGREEDQEILDFMDQLLDPDEREIAEKTTKKTQKKGKTTVSLFVSGCSFGVGRGQGRGVSKPKATKKTGTTKKGQPKGKKAAQNKQPKASEPLSPPAHSEVKTTLYDRIIAQQPDDGTSDASCLLWMPHLTEALLPSFDEEFLPCESKKSSDLDDVSVVYRILEDAGLEIRPNESTTLPTSCPLLPPATHMSPPTAETALEMAFILLGKSVATVEELQSVTKSRLGLATRGPVKNPSLELWPGWDCAKVFSDSLKGKRDIITCLTNTKNMFRRNGKNEKGEELWQCIPSTLPKKNNIKTETQDGKFSGGQKETKATRTATRRKRKSSAAPPADSEVVPIVKSFRLCDGEVMEVNYEK